MNIDLSTLNEEQRKAVTQTQGPYMINAGPGSGKTQVLTHRIAYLIEEEKVPPYHILALTFTNKAAKEMTRRIKDLIQEQIKGLWIGTFHSLFSKLLRIEAEALGLPKDFSIYDRTDSLALIKTLIKDLQLNEDMYKPNIVLNRISGAKNRLMDAHAYKKNSACIEDDRMVSKPHMAELFLHYQARCKQAGALDFDDLLLCTYQLLSKEKEIAHKYQQRFKYILVDEFQDTNQVQYAILKILAAHENLCVIGDDAQSIYAFRGANIHNILSFTQHFPKATTIRLEQNYRSTKYIVQAINRLIQHNKEQLTKKVFTHNAQGEPLSVVQTSNEVEEALYVVRSIVSTHQKQQLEYDNFAILYRTNSQSRILEEELRKNNVPYQILGGMSFYQRKEVKDLLSYLRVLINPNDEQALRRIINLPKRGIGPVTLQKIWGWASEHSCTIWEVMKQIEHFMQGEVAKAIKRFTAFITHYQEKLIDEDAYTIAKDIAEASGLLTVLYDDKTPEGLSRYENIQELLTSIQHFTEQEEHSLAEFLQEVSLLSNADEEEKDTPKVLLMTVHTAKGLEFPYVYIVGMEEKLFPSGLINEDEMEEERRLFYVALTRAKTKIYMTYTKTRHRFSQQRSCTPSRFLRELDASSLQIQHLGAPATEEKISIEARTGSYRSLHQLQATKQGVSKVPEDVKEGQRVKHPVFGEGRVLSLLIDGGHKKVIIDFEDGGRKTLLLSFAKLELL